MTRQELADLILKSQAPDIDVGFWRERNYGTWYSVKFFVPEPVPEKELKFEPADEQ